MPRNVLYYPFMDVPDTGWLRSALLQWDAIYTLVPEGVDVPCSSPETAELAAEGVVRRLPFDTSAGQWLVSKCLGSNPDLAAGLRIIEAAVEREPYSEDWHQRSSFVLHGAKFGQELFKQLLPGTMLRPGWVLAAAVRQLRSPDEQKRGKGRYEGDFLLHRAGIDPAGMSDAEMADALEGFAERAWRRVVVDRYQRHVDDLWTLGAARQLFAFGALEPARALYARRGEFWVRVSRPTAQLILGAAAVVAARERGLALVTDAPDMSTWGELLYLSDRYGEDVEVRVNEQTGDLSFGTFPSRQHTGPYPSGDLRMPVPLEASAPSAGRVLLARLAADTLSVAPDTPVRDILKFRRRYQSEMDRYLSALDDLCAGVAQAAYPSRAALEQALADQFRNEVRPALEELRAARRGAGIKAGPDLLRAGTFAVPAALLGPMAGHPVGGAVAAVTGVTLSLTASLWKSQEDQRAVLRGQPYAYLLHAREVVAAPQPSSVQRFWHRWIPPRRSV